MAIKLFRRRAPRPVGKKLESGLDKNKGGVVRNNWLIKTGILLILLISALAVFPRNRTYEFPVSIGETWQEEDLIAPQEFPIYKSEAEIQEEVEEIRRNTAPVFAEVKNTWNVALVNLDSLRLQLGRVFEAYSEWQLGLANEAGPEQIIIDSTRYAEQRNALGLLVSPQQWNYLLESYAARVPGLAIPSRSGSTTQTLDEDLLNQTQTIVRRFRTRNVVNVQLSTIQTEDIEVTDQQKRTIRYIPVNELNGYDEIIAETRELLAGIYRNRADTVALGLAFFRRVFQPTLVYEEDETEQRLDEKVARISRTRGLVQEGQVIIRKGDIVTEPIKIRLNSLSRTMAEQQGSQQSWRLFLGQLILTLICFSIFFFFLYFLRADIFQSNRHVSLITVVFLLVVGLYAVAIRFEMVPDLAVPVTIVSILLTVIYDSRVGVFATLSLALLGGLYFGYDFKFTAVTLFAGAMAVFSMRDIRNRAQLFTTCALILGAYMLMLGAFSLFEVVPWGQGVLMELVLVAINAGLVSMLFYPLLWVIEKTFRVTTDITLLELSDMNRPILRALSQRAPGSFQHTLQVANLSESAGDAIGANSLLARVGALYHDIGKMNKPEYFVENQQPGINPHDRQKPSMSALIISSHVKEGLELGRQHKLPQSVLDFIPTHHGTSRIEYFYRKALDATKPGDPPPVESDFRYPGPRPRTKETGVVMLADSIEAASKSLEKPTPKKLETLVDSIITSRIEDGQLDHCPLTFADLNVIKATFLSVLSGLYHFRVKYPGQEEEKEEQRSPADTHIEKVDVLQNGQNGSEEPEK